jgi:hypothetical protein
MSVFHSASQPLAISAPGGPARHFRVQVWEQGQNLWRMSGMFGDARAADACLRSLQQQGCIARLVRFGCLPTAA